MASREDIRAALKNRGLISSEEIDGLLGGINAPEGGRQEPVSYWDNATALGATPEEAERTKAEDREQQIRDKEPLQPGQTFAPSGTVADLMSEMKQARTFAPSGPANGGDPPLMAGRTFAPSGTPEDLLAQQRAMTGRTFTPSGPAKPPRDDLDAAINNLLARR